MSPAAFILWHIAGALVILFALYLFDKWRGSL